MSDTDGALSGHRLVRVDVLTGLVDDLMTTAEEIERLCEDQHVKEAADLLRERVGVIRAALGIASPELPIPAAGSTSYTAAQPPAFPSWAQPGDIVYGWRSP